MAVTMKPRGYAARVLVVDDQEEIAMLLAEMLALLGHEAVPCQSAQKALSLLESEVFDLILSDYRLGEMTGKEFYEGLRRVGKDLHERVIFLTGDTASAEVEEFLSSNSLAHLCKPFRLAAVQEIVTQRLIASRCKAVKVEEHRERLCQGQRLVQELL